MLYTHGIYWYMPCLLLIITLGFTWGEKKISSSIKMSLDIMNILVIFWLEFKLSF